MKLHHYGTMLDEKYENVFGEISNHVERDERARVHLLVQSGVKSDKNYSSYVDFPTLHDSFVDPLTQPLRVTDPTLSRASG